MVGFGFGPEVSERAKNGKEIERIQARLLLLLLAVLLLLLGVVMMVLVFQKAVVLVVSPPMLAPCSCLLDI